MENPLQNIEKTLSERNFRKPSGTAQTKDADADYPMPRVTPFELLEVSPQTSEPDAQLTNYSIEMHSFNLPEGLEASLSSWLNGKETSKQSETGKLSHLLNSLFK